MEGESATTMPSAEEAKAARLALELAAERMGTNPELVERERAARERAERERDQMVEVLAFLPETQRQDALVLASYRGENYKVSRLLDAGADKDGVGSEALAGVDYLDGSTPLAAACKGGHVTVVEELLEAGADAGKAAERGMTPLMRAANRDNVACFKRLLEVPGLDVNARADNGWTALHHASAGWSPECLTLLIDKGVNVDTRAGSGAGDASPLLIVLQHLQVRTHHIARTEMHCEHCVRLLLDAGADKDAQSNYGDTPLIYAIDRNRRNIVKILLKARCDVDLADNIRTTPLMHAASSGQLDVVEMLLEAGAKKMPVNYRGRTAFQLAEEKGHTQVMALLRDG